MKVYLINLDRHPDRLAHMREQLNGIAFERIAAVDGRTSRRRRKASRASSWPASKAIGSPGVNSSPVRTTHACFLEDDLHIWPGFGALIGSEAWIPADAHSIKLDTYLQTVELGDKRAALGGRESPGSIRATKAARLMSSAGRAPPAISN